MIMEISAALAVVIVFLAMVFTFASAWSLDVSVVIAVIVAVVSAGAAALSALFAWRSIGFARRQNTIAAQTALLESLLHKRSTLEDVMSEISHMMEHLIEEIPTSFSVMNRPRDFDSRNASFEKLIFGQQKTINIICCHQHYFDSNELILLQNYRQRVGKSGNLDNLREIIFAKDNCLAKFRDIIIPEKLAGIEKQIQNLEAKLKPLSE